MIKYVSPKPGYLVNIEDIDIDLELAVALYEDDEKTILKGVYFPATIKYGKSLLRATDVNINEKTCKRGQSWLELNPDGDGLIEYQSRYGDGKIFKTYTESSIEVLVKKDGSSPYIVEFESDTDAELYLNLVYEDMGGEEWYE